MTTDKKTYEDILVFSISGKRFALSVDAVDRVLPIMEVTKIPDAPPYLLGFIKVESEIIPVIDIRKKFEIKPEPISLNYKMIIAKYNNLKLSFIADSIEDQITVAPDRIKKSEEFWTGIKLLKGLLPVSDEVVLLINKEDIFSSLESFDITKLSIEK